MFENINRHEFILNIKKKTGTAGGAYVPAMSDESVIVNGKCSSDAEREREFS